MSDEQSFTVLLQLEADLPAPDRLDAQRLEQIARETLRLGEAPGDAMVSILIGTEEQVRDLNQQYRGVDEATDVLSFPSEPLPEEIDEDQGYLGDIIIALPYIVRRAQEESRSINDDLALMIVHGVLHLLGYDHDDQEAQAEMWALQHQVLQSLGIDLHVPDYLHE